MTTMTDPPGQGFRLSQLIYDTRYRSLTIQVVAMIVLMLLFSWLVSNTVHNLQTLGKDFDFGFLTQPSGYDINQRLIEYDSQSTHGAPPSSASSTPCSSRCLAAPWPPCLAWLQACCACRTTGSSRA